MLAGGVRAGFRLAGADGVSGASGTQIEGFVFDGRGVSAANLEPLGVAIIARSRTTCASSATACSAPSRGSPTRAAIAG